MALERSEGVLCLIGAETPQALAETIARILGFVTKSRGVRLIDVVYTATCDARGRQCVAGLWVASLEEMARKLRFALEALRSGRTRTREKSGVFFTTHPLALHGGKLAYIFPGTGSFHLEMMRDLALTFDGVRERFDDMEEAFSGFCDVASPSEWLFSTSPEHTLPLSASQAFLPLLASASTYLASKVFADLLKSVGVRPDAVGGVGLGAFSAFHATHHNPKFRLVQILRDAGRMLLRLGAEGRDRAPWVQLTVSGIEVSRLRELALRDPARVVLTQILTDDDCVMAISPDKQAEVEIAIHNGGGVSVAESLPAPFNSGHGDAPMRRRLRDFFVKYVNCEPQIPFYSCVDAAPMGRSTSAVVDGLMAQMMEPLDFRAMIRRMYDDGCRIFVEVGARGLLSPLIAKNLAGRDPVAVIPMHILHRSGGVQVGQALGLLAANGAPMDYSGLRFFAHARRLDFSVPVHEEGAAALTVHLSRSLPAIRPELIDAQHILSMVAAVSPEETGATHLHALPLEVPAGGLECPLLRGAQELARTATTLELQCVLRLADFPYLNDYAIGSSNISLRDPQTRGLTLLSVPSGLEIMAEAAHRLFPDLSLRRIETLRAPHWLAFDFGRLGLRLSASVLSDPTLSGNRTVAVRLCEDREEAPRVAMEAQFVLSPTIPEPPEDLAAQPLASPVDVGWKADDIYPARLFQGPLLRNIRAVVGWGLNGLDYEIRIPSRAALVRRSRNPLFCALPLLLDAVVSGFPLWRSHERFHGAISLPFRCKAIRYYAAWLPEGTRLRCSLRLTNVTPRTFEVDILAMDATGHPVLRVEGWEEVGGRAGPALPDFVKNPPRYFITQPLPDSILPKSARDGVDKTIVGALYVNANPDFFIANHGLWLNALAAAVLTQNEREDFAQMGGVAPRRLEWLLGRTAAKEAVRRLLLEVFRLYEPSADIAVWKDELGKPHPLGDWQQQISAPIDLSIAHTAGLVIGGATTHGRLGFDVESTSRDLTEDFLRGVFTLEEQELATRSGDGPIAVLRFWCAKEAISKALGTGIRFAPTDLRIRASDPATGELAIELLGAWAENFPNLRGKRIPIKTAVLYDHAIACCHLRDP